MDGTHHSTQKLALIGSEEMERIVDTKSTQRHRERAPHKRSRHDECSCRFPLWHNTCLPSLV